MPCLQTFAWICVNQTRSVYCTVLELSKRKWGVRCTLSDLLIISINGPALEVGGRTSRPLSTQALVLQGIKCQTVERIATSWILVCLKFRHVINFFIFLCGYRKIELAVLHAQIWSDRTGSAYSNMMYGDQCQWYRNLSIVRSNCASCASALAKLHWMAFLHCIPIAK